MRLACCLPQEPLRRGCWILRPFAFARAQICTQEGDPRYAPSSDLRLARHLPQEPLRRGCWIPSLCASTFAELKSVPKRESPVSLILRLWDGRLWWKIFAMGIKDVADPHKVGDGTTSSIKNQNIRKPGQVNEADPIVNRNRSLNVNQHKSIVKPTMKFKRIKGWDEVVADMKFQATKRKMQELYQRA
ncbi:hypothetical protein NL676_034621 [Syzygium grande]|nr:hypothetical protein NL676_034621 [Syzygium grande]